jgi:hypothetical protein
MFSLDSPASSLDPWRRRRQDTVDFVVGVATEWRFDGGWRATKCDGSSSLSRDSFNIVAVVLLTPVIG